jgi:hypothetical protein
MKREPDATVLILFLFSMTLILGIYGSVAIDRWKTRALTAEQALSAGDPQ